MTDESPDCQGLLLTAQVGKHDFREAALQKILEALEALKAEPILIPSDEEGFFKWLKAGQD